MRTVAINGIPRSGSTLVGQLVKGCLHPTVFNIIRTHPAIGYREPVDYTFITVRHPYDVAASRYRVRLSRSPDAGGLQGLCAEMVIMAQHYAGLPELMQLPHMLLRYEHFYQDYAQVFDAIEVAFNLRVPETTRYALTHKYSLDANKKRADSQENFLSYDEELVHGDHIGGVVPGSWKSVLPKELHLEMLEYCRPIAEELGYE